MGSCLLLLFFGSSLRDSPKHSLTKRLAGKDKKKSKKKKKSERKRKQRHQQWVVAAGSRRLLTNWLHFVVLLFLLSSYIDSFWLTYSLSRRYSLDVTVNFFSHFFSCSQLNAFFSWFDQLVVSIKLVPFKKRKLTWLFESIVLNKIEERSLIILVCKEKKLILTKYTEGKKRELKQKV